MVTSKNGGKNDLVSDSNALPLPKPVTSSILQQAKESAIASKRLLQGRESNVGNYVAKLSTDTMTGTPRTLTQEEISSLRESKQQVAAYVMRELASRAR